jgi:hypothetical protein
MEPREEAIALARGLAMFWEERLGPRLCGVYLLGSLAHGGYSARWSDIDVALVSEDGVSDQEIAAMRARAAALSPALAPKVSLFWADRGFTKGRFPPLDRMDYLDHAAPLAERVRVEPPRPALQDIRAYLRGQPISSFAELSRKFASAEALAPADRKRFLRTILYPARLLCSWETGAMASNDTAVDFLRRRRPPGLDLALIGAALRCRHDDSDPDPLFPERAALIPQHDACARIIG